MNRNLIRSGLVVALTLTGVLAVASPATAAPAAATNAPATRTASAVGPAAAIGQSASRADDETLPGLKAALTARIDLRLAALNQDLAAITAAVHLTEAHENELSTMVNDTIAGLTQLRATVEAETTVAGLRTAATSMVEDYRVYVLVGPQVRLTIAGDAALVAIDKAQQAHDALAVKVAQAKADGADTTTAETDLSQMQDAITSASANLDGQVEAILAISPGPDSTAIRNGVAAVRQAFGRVRSDLRTAVAEGRAVADFLR
jgi:hypothetical protein